MKSSILNQYIENRLIYQLTSDGIEGNYILAAKIVL